MKFTIFFSVLAFSSSCLGIDISYYMGNTIILVDATHAYVVTPSDLNVGEIHKVDLLRAHYAKGKTVYQLIARTNNGTINFEIPYETGVVSIGVQHVKKQFLYNQ